MSENPTGAQRPGDERREPVTPGEPHDEQPSEQPSDRHTEPHGTAGPGEEPPTAPLATGATTPLPTTEGPTTPLAAGATTPMPPAEPAPATTDAARGPRVGHDGTAQGEGAASAAPVWSAATVADQEEPRRTRTGTVVLGIVLVLIGVGAIVTAIGYRLDLQLAIAVLLVVAAVGLLVTPLLQRGDRAR
ncbi:hypothetical protein [Georgenia alba]|uniref:Uncharacterized protein n=1 Tax=Georgenia alba TaxID=2233858 RepID=A0ABW2QBV3_9MICO